MRAADLEPALSAIFRDNLQLDVPALDTDVIDTGILDSIAFVNLIVAIEEQLGIVVAVEEIELDDFRTIASIARHLARRAGGAPQASAGPAEPISLV